MRLSHSGEGCGPHWPSCHGGYLIDKNAESKTWIEWIHRATSGFFGLLVLLINIVTFIKVTPRHPLRKGVLLTLFLTVTEALIGARLVLAGLTTDNSSFMRAWTMNLHLLNSLLLMGSLFVCWRMALGKKYHWLVIKKKPVIIGILLFFIIAFFGSFSALSSSLFPSSSLWGGFLDDFNPRSHFLIRLRIWHPILALLGGLGLFYWFWQGSFWKNKKTKKILILSLSLALLSGLLNLILLSPVFLKLTHLVAVYLLEISFLWFVFEGPQAKKLLTF